MNAASASSTCDFSILKGQGKPFFPYAVAKDGLMAAITVGVIVFMAILFGPSSAQGRPPPPPTRRAGWYFFFLFELLPVVKPPELVFLATIGIPTSASSLLLMLPFFDRSPSATAAPPIATTAGIATIAAMAYLTVLGALAGSPTEIELATSPQYEEGKEITASSGCLGATRSARTATRSGRTSPTSAAAGPDAIARTLVNPTSPMPSFQSLAEESRAVRQARRLRRLPQGRGVAHPVTAPHGARCPKPGCARCSTASPASTTA